MPEAAWDRVLDINLKGPFLCSQAFARTHLAPTGGAIVNVASTAAFSARVGAAHYSASKAGVVMLTKSLAQEFGACGIRVNAVAPGLIEVDEGHVSAEYKEMFLKMVPRGRIGRPEDVAAAVAFLLTQAADYINGECIVVDGGFLAGRALLQSTQELKVENLAARQIADENPRLLSGGKRTPQFKAGMSVHDPKRPSAQSTLSLAAAGRRPCVDLRPHAA